MTILAKWLRRAMKPVVVCAAMLGVILVAGCSSRPPDGVQQAAVPPSLQTELNDRRRSYEADCRRQPEDYGFPYTREDVLRLQQAFETSMPMPSLFRHCSRVARILAGTNRQ